MQLVKYALKINLRKGVKVFLFLIKCKFPEIFPGLNFKKEVNCEESFINLGT